MFKLVMENTQFFSFSRVNLFFVNVLLCQRICKFSRKFATSVCLNPVFFLVLISLRRKVMYYSSGLDESLKSKSGPLRLLLAGLPGVQPTEHPGGHGQYGRHGPAVGRAERGAGFHSDGETRSPPSTSRHSGSLIDFIFLQFLAVDHVHLLLTH